MEWELWQRLEELRARGERAALATVVQAPPGSPVRAGARMLYGGGGVQGSLGHPDLDRAVVEDAQRLLSLGASRTYGYRLGPDGKVEAVRERRALLEAEDAIRVFIEVVAPPPLLVVFGAGHDAVPLVHVARLAGFRVVVVDPREAFLTRERFPDANRLVRAHPEEVPERLELPPDACAVVMTHNYLQDQVLLRFLLPRPLAYLGVLGPWERTERLLSELAQEGLAEAASPPPHLYAPIGMDIGAEGPEQIAIAVVAEILAVRHGKSGGSLRLRKGPIHPEWRAV